MREIVHIQAGQCGNQIGAKVRREWIELIYWINSRSIDGRVGKSQTFVLIFIETAAK